MKIQQEGLKSAYELPDEDPELCLWLRNIMTLTMLPVFAITLIWQVLKFPPCTNEPSGAKVVQVQFLSIFGLNHCCTKVLTLFHMR